jgi:hypothetical protein
MRAWLTLTTSICGLSSSASLTAHYALPVNQPSVRINLRTDRHGAELDP